MNNYTIIKKEHILKAIEYIDKFGYDKMQESKKYSVLYKGMLYPTKVLISVAYKYASDSGMILKSNEFNGGISLNEFLSDLGFDVKTKTPKHKNIRIENSVNRHFEIRNTVEEKATSNEKFIIMENYLEILKKIRENFKTNYFYFENQDRLFTDILNKHFKEEKNQIYYGCYIIMKKDNLETIYIGKAGTLTNDFSYKLQGIRSRLSAIRGNNIYANDWFDKLRNMYGELKIEYIVIDKPEIVTPAFLESYLLQSYIFTYKKLPSENKSF